MRKKQKPAAFSLVELVVVISLITMVLALVVPLNKTKREAAQDAICKSNLKTISTAAAFWSIDNDDWVLPGSWDKQSPEGEMLGGYLDYPEAGKGVMLCPAVAKKYIGKTYGELGLTHDLAGIGSAGDYYRSYGYNLYLCNRTSRPLGIYDYENDNETQWGKDNTWYYKHGNTRLSTIKNPAEKVIFADCISFYAYPALYNKPMLNPEFKDPAHRGRRHYIRQRAVAPQSTYTEMAGLMNIAWADGSVSSEPDDMEEFNYRSYEITTKYWFGD